MSKRIWMCNSIIISIIQKCNKYMQIVYLPIIAQQLIFGNLVNTCLKPYMTPIAPITPTTGRRINVINPWAEAKTARQEESTQ